MCNACGFLCCAYDGFSGCGCDHCEYPACWPQEDEDYGDDFDMELSPSHRSRFFCTEIPAAGYAALGRGPRNPRTLVTGSGADLALSTSGREGRRG